MRGDGNGAGEGGHFTGGSYGVYSVSSDSGSTGVYGAGGPGGYGLYGYGGTSSGIGVVAIGQGTGVGGRFQGGTNAASINLIPRSGDPSTVVPGDIWFDSTAGANGKFRGRNNSGSVDLG